MKAFWVVVSCHSSENGAEKFNTLRESSLQTDRQTDRQKEEKDVSLQALEAARRSLISVVYIFRKSEPKLLIFSSCPV